SRAEMQEWLAAALAEQPATALLVTHDVEEALYLCDRVLVLGARPTTSRATIVSPSPRATPRLEAVTSPEFTRARELALEALAGGSR
ncbi:MAG: ABC transporter ATP-binding protein, partial [Solirubrobacterales bacterium]